jgi:hypothetical protein
MKSFKKFVKEACWAGYKQVGIKEKNGRKVPNCVPEEADVDEAYVHTDFTDKTTPMGNRKAYAAAKANDEKKPVSLKKAPWDKKNEEVEQFYESDLSSEDLNRIAKDHDIAANKHKIAYAETKSIAASRNHEVAYNRHVDAAKAHREAVKDKNKHSSEKLEKISNHAWDATDHVRKHFDEEVEIDEGKNLTDTKADWRSDKSATAKNWSHNKLMKVAKHDRSAEKEIKRRIASKEYVFANEEVELDELKKSTLGSYIKRAAGERGHAGIEAGASASGSKDQKDAMSTMKKRLKGIKMASDRLAKESVEELDELKKSTLGSYVNRAADDISHIQRDITSSGTQSPDYKNLSRMRRNRKGGIATAVKKLTREEVEELDELSPNTLSSYASKANIDASKARSHMRVSAGGKDFATHKKRYDKRTAGAVRAGEKYRKLVAREEIKLDEASDLRITKVYNKFPKKATYAVHSPDRKYYKEFDSMEKAKAHHAEKTGK